jgi:Protein of unknown function (DUF2795)
MRMSVDTQLLRRGRVVFSDLWHGGCYVRGKPFVFLWEVGDFVEIRTNGVKCFQERRKMMAHVSPIEVEKHLKGVDYPVNKQELVKHARKQGANKEVLETLKDLPEESFKSPIDVSKAIGQASRH